MIVFSEIKKLLDSKHVNYSVLEHKPVGTSEEVARERGEDIKIGIKAMVFKGNKGFFMVAISAAYKIDSKKVREKLKLRKLRFASPEELKELTSCISGAVPPFGHLFGLKMYLDETVLKNENVAFNAGRLDRSIKMKKEDYLKSVEFEVVNVKQ